jgi:AcrR family transcriptional regulator
MERALDSHTRQEGVDVVNPGSSEVAGGAGDWAGGGLDLVLPDPLKRELERVDGRAGRAGFAGDAGDAGGQAATDGRLARGRRTRRNVADALMALLREGDPDPTAKAVAARAGVSLRLVFHHFADMDDLYHFVAALQLRQLWSGLPRPDADLSLAARVDRTVAHRAVLFEEASPVRHALARRATSSPAVAQALAAADALLLESLRATFAPELRALGPVGRNEYLCALDGASSWELWGRLRSGPDGGVGAQVARRIMTRMLTVLSTAPVGADLRVRPARPARPARGGATTGAGVRRSDRR